MQPEITPKNEMKAYQIPKKELISSFNTAVETLDATISSHQFSLPEQKIALRNLINQAINIVAKCNIHDESQSKRVHEFITVITGANSLLRGEPIDSNTINIMNKEMANASFFDKKLNRVLAGIAFVVSGMTVMLLAALLTPIWHVCRFCPLTKFGLVMLSLGLTTPIFMLAGGNMALYAPARTVAEELSEVVRLFNAPQGLVPVKNEASWSFGLSHVFFKNNQPERQGTEYSSTSALTS